MTQIAVIRCSDQIVHIIAFQGRQTLQHVVLERPDETQIAAKERELREEYCGSETEEERY